MFITAVCVLFLISASSCLFPSVWRTICIKETQQDTECDFTFYVHLYVTNRSILGNNSLFQAFR